MIWFNIFNTGDPGLSSFMNFLFSIPMNILLYGLAPALLIKIVSRS